MNSNNRNMKELRILQMNVHKSKTAAFDLINEHSGPKALSRKFDVICLQEPWTDKLGNARRGQRWDIIYPTSRLKLGEDSLLRSIILINRNISTNNWRQIEIPDSNNITAIQIEGNTEKINIFNIYLDGLHSNALDTLKNQLSGPLRESCFGQANHMIWCSDFNRHHPKWDAPENHHLFTTAALKDAETLLETLDRFNMSMTLPPHIPTFFVPTSGIWTRPDNVFISESAESLVMLCDVAPHLQANGADHIPIATTININVPCSTHELKCNFRMVCWKDFRSTLLDELEKIPQPHKILSVEDMNATANDLTKAIQATIEKEVPPRKPSPNSRRWWTHELLQMKKTLNKLSNQAYKSRALPDHPIHRELKAHRTAYKKKIFEEKEQHWKEFLEGVDENTIFTAAKYATALDIDTDFRTVIPTLKTLNEDGSVASTAITNEEKATLLASVFFPKAPPNAELNRNPCRNPLPDPPPFTEERIIKKLQSLSPYKAPGSDGIPNVVLGKCADLLSPYLVHLFNSFDKLKAFVEAWLYSDTGVLRKPGKASYFFAKCFRPIALIMTLAKAYTSLLADDISHVAELLGLIPPTQFGGRPGRMTTDGIHLAIDHIMNTWRNKRDAAMLSLDIEGAFPNAVTQRVLYNMRKRRVPEKLVQAVSRVLIGRKTRIRFGDFTSEYMELTNGIGQGDPLSMIVYIFYNTDFFDI